jgi:Fur family iron response transcriptional regulator
MRRLLTQNHGSSAVRQNARFAIANLLHLPQPSHIISFVTINRSHRQGLPESWISRMTPTRTMVFSNTLAHAGHQSAVPPRTDLTGCPWHDVKSMLRHVGLRPTRQRMALGWILFAKGDRHLTAEMLYEEASNAKVPVSLATVYNTLHQFTDVGLLRQVAVDGSKTYFDTNVSDHHHFFVEDENELVDIPKADVIVGNTPAAPEGYEIARVDVVVRLRRKGR